MCQLVEGMPLAIELAAPWIRVMPCQEIAQHIERDLGLLASSLRDMPQRHRSMRAVFDHSWELLAAEEREVLAKLSVFRGGFRRAAAEVVAMRLPQSPASLTMLSSLVDKSWLRPTPSGRYQMHELVRQYAAERLEADHRNSEQVRDRHSEYYAAFLDEREARLKGRGQRQALQEIVADMDNVRAAWSWALERGDLSAIGQCAESLWHTARSRGWLYEVAENYDRAVARLKEQLDLSDAGGTRWSSEEIATVMAEILHREAFARLRLGMNAQAKELGEESLGLLECLGDDLRHRKARAHAKLTLGMALHHLGDLRRANPLVEDGLADAAAIGDIWGTTRGLRSMAWYAFHEGRYSEAEELQQRTIAILEEAGEDVRRAVVLGSLSWVLCAKGEFERAELTAQEGLRIHQGLESESAMYSLQGLAQVAMSRGDYDLAERYYRDALAIAVQTGNRRFEVACLRGCGWVAHELCDYPEASRLFEDALAGARDMEDRFPSVAALVGLGYATCGLGQLRRARQCFGQALEGAMRMDLMPLALDALVGLASISANEAEPNRAIELLALTLHHPASAQVTKDSAQYLLSGLESELLPEVFAEAVERGRTRELEEVVTEVLRVGGR